MFSLRVPSRLSIVACAVLAAVAGMPEQAPREAPREDAYRANNVGVAHLEQYDYDRAAASFRDALARNPGLDVARVNLAIALFYAGQDEEALGAASAVAGRMPDLPYAHYVVGLAARSQGRTEEALAAFGRVLKLDPADAGSRINLGQILLQQRQYDEAIRLFREALTAEPFNVTAAYGLATARTRSAGPAAAREDMQRFETLRDSAYGVTYSQRYLEQGRYAEAIVSTGAEPDLVDPAPPAVSFSDATAAMFGKAGKPAGDFPVSATPGGSVTLFDADADGDLDLFATSTTGGSPQRFFLNASGSFSDATGKARLGAGEGPAAVAAVAADYDNDLRPDLLLLRPGRPRLLHQREDRSYEDVTEKAGITTASPLPRTAAFVDTDHDGDLDIFIASSRLPASAPAAPQLLRNNGNGTFTDITAAAGFADGAVDAVGIAPTDFDNRRDIDILVVGAGAAPRLFQNMRDGTFRDAAADVGLPSAAAYSALAAADVNKDGFVDFYFGRRDAAGVMAISDGRGRFNTGAGPDGGPGANAAQFIDYDNDGLLDLFTAHGRSIRLFRNIGGRWSDVSSQSRLAALADTLSANVLSVSFGDLDRDGDLDAVALLANGELRSWRNDGGNKHRSLLVKLAGRVSNRGGIGSKVDIRAGSLRQRAELSAVTPSLTAADVLFGLGARGRADVVRVVWPSGTLQAETTTDGPDVTIAELDRKPSSCPYLYTWNGSRFEFVTDFMGGGEIGYWQAPGVWNTPDPDEYVRIRSDQLVARGGRYDLRVTNELEEALFVDRLQLVAVDHEARVDVFPNEGLGAPASREFLTTTRDVRPPVAATDEHGHDVLDRLARADRKYPDDFALVDIRGYAAEHELRLDLGDASGAVLLATGWTDYAFSGDNVAAHHRGMQLTPPSLDARTAAGSWRRVLSNIGIPVGRPQTVVVDLRDKLRPGEHEIRIVTNMRIYWDRILVDRSGGAFPVAVHRIDPVVADLRWRGFSAEISPDGRQPFTYDYDRVTRVSPWKTMTGRYTREGDVRPLLSKTDDMFVIARPGDEIALSFDAAALPALPPGKSRTYLLYSDGFSKEMDINSATPYTVEPLPFHAMRTYPYAQDQRYPSTPAHRDYRARYNTRTISKPLPPLEIQTENTKR
jgi:tetratricopeptide (TPR) repeat protein